MRGVNSEEEGRYRIIGEYAMASPDLVHWYEKPEGVSMAEFTASLPRPVPVAAAFEPCRVYWGTHGCDLERGHAGAGRDAARLRVLRVRGASPVPGVAG